MRKWLSTSWAQAIGYGRFTACQVTLNAWQHGCIGHHRASPTNLLLHLNRPPHFLFECRITPQSRDWFVVHGCMEDSPRTVCFGHEALKLGDMTWCSSGRHPACCQAIHRRGCEVFVSGTTQTQMPARLQGLVTVAVLAPTAARSFLIKWVQNCGESPP